MKRNRFTDKQIIGMRRSTRQALRCRSIAASTVSAMPASTWRGFERLQRTNAFARRVGAGCFSDRFEKLEYLNRLRAVVAEREA